jgi:hypothetical protein
MEGEIALVGRNCGISRWAGVFRPYWHCWKMQQIGTYSHLLKDRDFFPRGGLARDSRRRNLLLILQP